MRKFRTAAVAVTSAVALTISGTAIASAQTQENTSAQTEENTSSNYFDDGEGYNYGETLKDIADAISSGAESSEIGTQLGADEDANAEDTEGEVKVPGTSDWAQFWRDTTLLGVIGTVVGAIIGLVNFAKFNGII